jgi:hypothetical protein
MEPENIIEELRDVRLRLISALSSLDGIYAEFVRIRTAIENIANNIIALYRKLEEEKKGA